jgi:NADH-quinone oxidoreductase subunit J
VPSQVAFGLFSIIVIVSAWRVVTSPNVVRAALALVVVLAGIAPIFLMLAAEFVAVAQILVYVGAVVVLFLFAIMVTRAPMTRAKSAGTLLGSAEVDNRHRWPGFVIGLALFLTLWAAIRDAFGDENVQSSSIGTTARVGDSLLRQHVIPFEVVSVLLLAVLVGAVALARHD